MSQEAAVKKTFLILDKTHTYFQKFEGILSTVSSSRSSDWISSVAFSERGLMLYLKGFG